MVKVKLEKNVLELSKHPVCTKVLRCALLCFLTFNFTLRISSYRRLDCTTMTKLEGPFHFYGILGGGGAADGIWIAKLLFREGGGAAQNKTLLDLMTNSQFPLTWSLLVNSGLHHKALPI